MTIRLQTLGSVELRRDGVEVRSVLAQPKRLALLVYLATAAPRGFVARESLLALFWPEADQERARNSLRQSLHYLRRSLGDDVVVGRGEREVGVDPARLSCDAAEFDEALADGRFEEALEAYRGDFLPGFYVEDAPEAERWLEEERTRRRRLAVEAARSLAARDEAAGAPRAGALWARRALALEPHDEGALRHLLRLLDQDGETAAALQAFAEFARRLKAEYDLDPSDETLREVERIRDRAAGPPPPAPPPAQLTAPVGAAEPAHAPSPAPSPDLAPEPSIPIPTSKPAPPPIHARRGGKALRLAAAAVVVVALAWGGWAVMRPGEPTDAAAEAPPTIAVLPFANMSGDPEKEYFSDGITEELLNVLARLPGLQVSARTSSFAFKGKDVPVDSIARVLRVAHVLEGSVRSQGDSVRITAQLIDARTGYHLWSQTYDRAVRDVFAVQDEISAEIAAALRLRLDGGAGAAGRPAETANPQAHALVLRGAHAFRQGPAGLGEAAALFGEAARLDPGYARAHAGLANALSWQVDFGRLPRDEGYERARAAALRALELDPAMADAHLVLGRIAHVTDALDEAERHYARALELNPRDPRVHSRRAHLFSTRGQMDEAIAAALRATEMDPISPAALSDLASMYYRADRYEEALAVNTTALRLSPDNPLLLSNRALVLSEMGRADEAVEAMERARAVAPGESFSMGGLAFLYARAGRADEARAALREYEEAPGFEPYNAANVYHVLGDRARTLELLERAVDLREERAMLLATDTSSYRSLRGDPRMQRLLRRIEEVRGAP